MKYLLFLIFSYNLMAQTTSSVSASSRCAAGSEYAENLQNNFRNLLIVNEEVEDKFNTALRRTGITAKINRLNRSLKSLRELGKTIALKQKEMQYFTVSHSCATFIDSTFNPGVDWVYDLEYSLRVLDYSINYFQLYPVGSSEEDFNNDEETNDRYSVLKGSAMDPNWFCMMEKSENVITEFKRRDDELIALHRRYESRYEVINNKFKELTASLNDLNNEVAFTINSHFYRLNEQDQSYKRKNEKIDFKFNTDIYSSNFDWSDRLYFQVGFIYDENSNPFPFSIAPESIINTYGLRYYVEVEYKFVEDPVEIKTRIKYQSSAHAFFLSIIFDKINDQLYPNTLAQTHEMILSRQQGVRIEEEACFGIVR